METIEISSGLAHFRLIARLREITSKRIRVEAHFDCAPVYAGLEAMAQAAALHARHSLRLERHAFLLTIRNCRMPDVDTLDGTFDLTADLRSRSSDAHHYATAAQDAHGAAFHGEMLIGIRDYDGHFKKDILQSHYKQLLDGLKEV